VTDKKRKANRQEGWVPLGIGSHHALIEDQATFGDYEFKRTDVGNYAITFFDVGCRKKEWPPPVMFTNVSGDRRVAIQSWECKKRNFIVSLTSEEGGQMADYDFSWIVYR
jgi:hypothetical protein